MKKHLIMACSVLLLLSSCASIKRGEQADPQLVQQLMRKSGLDVQLEQYPGMIQAGLVQARKDEQLQNFADDEFNELVGLVGTAYNAQQLKEGVQRWLSAHLSETDMKSALAWLGSPIGEKITRLEVDASIAEVFAASRSMAIQLASDPARVALIKKLDHAMKGTESAMNAVQYTSMALLTAVYTEYSPELRPSAEEIEAVARKSIETIRQQFEPLTLHYFLYTYRPLSDAELAQYIAFCESAAGKKYIEVGHAALNDVMLQASRELGADVGKMFMRRSQPGEYI